MTKETPFYVRHPSWYLSVICLRLQCLEDKFPVTLTQWPQLKNVQPRLSTCYDMTTFLASVSCLHRYLRSVLSCLNHLSWQNRPGFACLLRYWRSSSGFHLKKENHSPTFPFMVISNLAQILFVWEQLINTSFNYNWIGSMILSQGSQTPWHQLWKSVLIVNLTVLNHLGRQSQRGTVV